MGSETDKQAAAAAMPTQQRGRVRRFCVPCTLLMTIIAITMTVFVKIGLLTNPLPTLVVENIMSDTIILRSAAFADGESIPPTYTSSGDNVSPPMSWHDVPKETVSFVLIVENVDVAGGKTNPWVHWVLYDVPPILHGLPQHVKSGTNTEMTQVSPRGNLDTVPVYQGVNSWGTVGYHGPEPPIGMGPHRYFFHLYAIDGIMGEFPSAPTRSDVLAKMYSSFNVLAKGTVMGTFERKI